MKTNELKEIDYLKTWALITVCATVGGFIVGALVGGICGGILGGIGVSIRTIKVICGVLGFVVGLPVSYFFFRLFVSRFIVQKLTSPDPGNVSPFADPSASERRAA